MRKEDYWMKKGIFKSKKHPKALSTNPLTLCAFQYKMSRREKHMSITKENRLESYIQRPVTRQETIYQIMVRLNEPVTARQLGWYMRFKDLNAVKPRITEMYHDGKIRPCGKAFDQTTKRHVTLWEVVK